MRKFAHRFCETTTATDMTTIALGGAVPGGQTLLAIINKGAAKNDPNRILVGDDLEITIESPTQFMEGVYTVISPTVLQLKTLYDSSNADGSAVTNWTGTRKVFCTPSAQWLSKVPTTDDGVTLAQLGVAGNLNGTDTSLVSQDSGQTVLRATLAQLKTFITNGTTDTTAPSVPGSLSTSGVGQNVATLNWTASTDNSGAAPSYEVSRDGTSWTAVAAGTLNYQFTGLTAATGYTLQVRSVDGSGNRSTAASIAVTTSAAAGGDTTAPTMSGSINTSNVTQTAFTMSYAAGLDNVGIVKYQISTDGGTTWIDNGTNLSYTKSNAAAGTTYNLRVRAYDAANYVSNVLTGSVTTVSSAPDYIMSGPPLEYAAFPANTTMTASGSEFYAGSNPALYLKTAAGVAPAAGTVKYVWGKSATVPPMAYSDAAPATTSGNGNTSAHGNAVGVPSRTGGWVNPGDAYYGLYSASSVYAWGTKGDWYLWVLTADGFAKPYDNGTGTPIKWTLS